VLTDGLFKLDTNIFEYTTVCPYVGDVNVPATVKPHTVVKDELPPRPEPVL
jgi:hypothetical protein